MGRRPRWPRRPPHPPPARGGGCPPRRAAAAPRETHRCCRWGRRRPACEVSVADYNAERQHGAWVVAARVPPQRRFPPPPPPERALVELWVPPALAPPVTPGPAENTAANLPAPGEWHGGPIEF